MCTTLIAGRNRSATGNVILAHSEELGRNSAHKVVVVPGDESPPSGRFPLHSGGSVEQDGARARHLATVIFDKNHYPGEHTSGINEHGVAVANNMAMMRGIPEARMHESVPGAILWTEFLQLVLERAKSARQGMELIASMCERHGLSGDSGTMIAVADADEAWWVELTRDGLWAAERVGDDEVSVRANCFRIGAAGAAAGCSRLEPYARERGWHAGGRLDFATVFGEPANQQDRYNLDRHDAMESKLATMGRVGVAEMMALLREVYEGTPLHRPGPGGSPFRTGVRTIARMNTEACAILEPRRGMPAWLAQRMWCCLSTSLTGTFVPFHVGIDAIEPHYANAGARYSGESAYWLFTELAKLADYRYSACIAPIRDKWKRFEAETFRRLDEAEARALTLPPAQGLEEIGRHDGDRAGEAIRLLGELLVEAKTLAFHEDY